MSHLWIKSKKQVRASKDQQDFMKLYQPVHADFERFCRARVYGEMEHGDLMNETLLVAYKKRKELKDQKAFLSYLIGIAVRLLSNSHNKKKPERASELDLTAISDSQIKGDTQTDLGYLRMALAELAPEARESIILFELTGFSIKEICKIQNSKESAVKQRLRRARLQLKELLMDRVSAELDSNGRG